MRLFRPLRRAEIALLWGGQTLSALGDQLYGVALSWIAVEVLSADAGYLTALRAAVMLLAALGIGHWADRRAPLRSMIGADLARAAILLIVVALWSATGQPSILQLATAILVLSLGEVVFEPALQSVLPALVEDRSLLPAANGLLDATERSARLLGPGLVALLAGVLPIMHFLTLDAASFAVSAAALLLIGRRRVLPAAPEATGSGMLRGLRAIAGHPLLFFMLRATALLNGAWYAVFFLAVPLLIAERGIAGPGGSGLGAYGLVISAYGCTNLAATLVIGNRAPSARPQFQIFGGNLMLAAGMAVMALAALLLPSSGVLAGLMAGAAIGAVGGPMQDIPRAVLWQTRLPVGDLPAAMRAYLVMSAGGMLLAMLIAPATCRLSGAASVIAGSAAIYLAVGTLGLVRHAGWREIEPQAA